MTSSADDTPVPPYIITDRAGMVRQLELNLRSLERAHLRLGASAPEPHQMAVEYWRWRIAEHDKEETS